VHEMVSQVDDPATRLAKGMTDAEIDATRLGRFRVNHAIGDPSLARRFDPGLLDEIMGKVPGLDGLGATIHEEYTDTNTAYNPFIQRLLEFKTSGRMNSAFYRRFYSYESPGAAGRRHYRFGYNDPMLFRAASSQSQVVALPGMGGNHRISWAIPLELIVATPLSPFNPYNIALLDHPPSGGGRTSSSPLTHAYKLGSFYMLPIDMFDGGASDLNDVADTDEKRWVLDGNGTPRFLRGSGVYIHLPHLNGRQARLRWPIAPVHHEGSFEFGHFEAVRKETQGAIAAMADAITDMKHTARYGGNNGS